jgi:hypothetical protein
MKNGKSWIVLDIPVYKTIHDLRIEAFYGGGAVRRIVISGLVALAAVLGGVAVPAAAMAGQPAAAGGQTDALRAGSLVAMRTGGMARPSVEGGAIGGEPLISCVLATDCLGIEGLSSQSDDGNLSIPPRVARWNGSTWKGVRVTLPKGTKSVDLYGVSCTGAKSCLVVGDYYTSASDNATSHPLALSYNGVALKPTPAVPLPKGTEGAALTSVSCATSRYCVAFGVPSLSQGISEGSGSLIIETWNGARWTLHTPAGLIGRTTLLQPTLVSCATSAFCVLAGQVINFSSNSPVTLYLGSWNGKKLTTMKSAAVSSKEDPSPPTGLSCATAANCAVTGSETDGASSGVSRVTAFTEIWNGRTWRLGTVTWPKGDSDSLLGVSCYAAHACEAVGADTSGGETSSVDAAAVAFDGTTGTLQAVPTPSKGHSALLAAVSCLPWGDCVAVGETGKTTTSTPARMTGVWNGKAWRLDPGF